MFVPQRSYTVSKELRHRRRGRFNRVMRESRPLSDFSSGISPASDSEHDNVSESPDNLFVPKSRCTMSEAVRWCVHTAN